MLQGKGVDGEDDAKTKKLKTQKKINFFFYGQLQCAMRKKNATQSFSRLVFFLFSTF